MRPFDEVCNPIRFGIRTTARDFSVLDEELPKLDAKKPKVPRLGKGGCELARIIAKEFHVLREHGMLSNFNKDIEI